MPADPCSKDPWDFSDEKTDAEYDDEYFCRKIEDIEPCHGDVGGLYQQRSGREFGGKNGQDVECPDDIEDNVRNFWAEHD